MPRSLRRFLVASLLAALAVPAAFGRPVHQRSGGTPPTPSGRLLVLFSAWLGRTLPADWLKEGCKIDPAGLCAPNLQTENGCLIEPNGHCAPNTQADAGCLVDPSGHCARGH